MHLSEGRPLSMLDRAVQLLKAFRPDGAPLTFSELVHAGGLSRTTTHRLAHDLVRIGLLRFEDNRYSVGLMLFELGRLVPVSRTIRDAAVPFLQDLFEATHETVHLGLRDGFDVVYAEKIHGHGSIDLPSRVGGRLPLSCTAVGKALLAADSVAEAQVLKHPLPRLTSKSITDASTLAAQLVDARQTGVTLEREESNLGVACVASAIIVDGRATAAVSVSVPIDRYEPWRLAAAVRTTALGISRQLSLPGSRRRTGKPAGRGNGR
ncbi:IclR family transcriptional regulator [Aeromicrobium sp. P5_D10]